jgi:hypothetical protein
MRFCPYIRNLWINGRWQVLAPWDTLVPLRMIESDRVNQYGHRIAHSAGMASHASTSLPLGNLKPGHVVEIRYSGCKQSPLGPRGNNALFVTLKAGIAFDPERGSYVVDSALLHKGVPLGDLRRR